MKPIKIYFTDLKPEKQRELLPELKEFFDGEIPSPLVEFFYGEIGDKLGELRKFLGIKKKHKSGFETTALYLDPHDRREQDAQIASENRIPEQKIENRFDF